MDGFHEGSGETLMLKKRRGSAFSALIVGLDAVAISCGLILTYILRFVVKILPVSKGYNPSEYLRLFPFALILWMISLNLVHIYEPRKRVFSFLIAWRIVKGSFLAAFIIVGLNYFLREAEYSRPIIIMAPFVVIGVLCLFRYILSVYLTRMGMKKGIGITPVLIVGTGPVAGILARRIKEHPQYGFRLEGFLTENAGEVGQSIEGHPVLGLVNELHNWAKSKGISEVMLARPDLKTNHLVDFLLDCEKELITVHVVPDLLEIMSTEISVNEVGGVPLFGLKESPMHGMNLLIKRAFDIAFSVIILILISPILLIIAIVIKLDSKGPVIYAQERVGADGRQFIIYKFRSMRVDAEKDGPVWAKSNDPRCTKIGALLRRHNLDELPQFFNVVRGDMSLVGPRPERPYYVEKFKNGIPRYMARHRVKSGITGWAQVNGLRGDSSIEERVKYDLFYIENWNLLFDIKILIMTLFTFF